MGQGAFVEGLQRCLLAVGAAIERGDTARALDLLAALLGRLSGAPAEEGSPHDEA